ncbi:hypothetical protein KSS87_012936 [Heliosperma pusillum]|nr:hypothetical protein KSS87_003552 [Heliosperma pusillum]KAH9611493.1 hypothetical protein KSS87_012936 [Heliosperma pusillum]
MHCNRITTGHTPTTYPFTPNRVSSPPSTPFRISFPTHPGITLKTRATMRDGYTTYSHPGSQLSLYKLLDIPETGSQPEIKQAYKQLARRYHPDVSPPDRVKEYTDRFIRVHEAYETLSDPSRRAVYDLQLSSTSLHHLSFPTKNIVYPYNNNNEATVEKSVWTSNWQSQVSELKNRSMHKTARANTSSGARMRRQRN